MKKSTIWKSLFTLTLMTFGYLGLNAQTLSVNSQTLSQHGYNSSGVSVATENTDSVTIGSITRYYVVPDATANGSYSLTGGVPTGALSSSFNWTFTGATNGASGTVAGVGTYGAFTNYRQVTWSATSTPATVNLNVQEVSAANCGSGTTQVIPVAVVAAPTLTYPAAAGIEDTCATGTNGSLDIIPSKLFWVNFTSPISASNKGIQMHVNITRANGGTPAPVVSNLLVNFTQTSATSGYFTIPNVVANQFDYFDTYTLTLVDISDRISRKANNTATGLWNAASGNTTFTYYLYRVPQTGPVYHLPNM